MNLVISILFLVLPLVAGIAAILSAFCIARGVWQGASLGVTHLRRGSNNHELDTEQWQRSIVWGVGWAAGSLVAAILFFGQIFPRC